MVISFHLAPRGETLARCSINEPNVIWVIRKFKATFMLTNHEYHGVISLVFFSENHDYNRLRAPFSHFPTTDARHPLHPLLKVVETGERSGIFQERVSLTTYVYVK